jgi:hypothetical protein
MRLVCVLLLAVLGAGCGAGSGTHFTSRPVVATTTFPTISVLNPNSAPVNSVPFFMTINGSNFGTDAVVFWNGVPQRTTFVSGNQLVVAITDSDLSFTGLAHVFVQSAGMNSNTVDFNVSPQ